MAGGMFPWNNPFNVPSWMGQVAEKEGEQSKKLPNAQVKPSLPGEPPGAPGEEGTAAPAGLGQAPLGVGPGGGPEGPKAAPRPTDRPMGQGPTGGQFDQMLSSRLSEWGAWTEEARKRLSEGNFGPFTAFGPEANRPAPMPPMQTGSPFISRQGATGLPLGSQPARQPSMPGPGGGVQPSQRAPAPGPSLGGGTVPRAPNLMPFTGQLRSTSGQAVPVGQGWFRVETPQLRAWTGTPSPGHAAIQFRYMGAPAQVSRLESGGMREQIALRAGPNQMNQFIVGWRKDGTINVEMKWNPGMSNPGPGEDNAVGYSKIRPTSYRNAPPLVPGSQHELYYTIQGNQLTVTADGQPVWQGVLPPEALHLARQEQNVRADNFRGDFSLSFPGQQQAPQQRAAPTPNPSNGMVSWGGWAWGKAPVQNVVKAGFKWFEAGYPDTHSPQELAYLTQNGVTPFAYINMGELHPDLRGKAGYQGGNIRTNNYDGTPLSLVDVTHPSWQSWLLRRATESYQRGHRGIKFDVATPDVPPGKTRQDVTNAMAQVLQEIKGRFPDMKIVLNQGWDIAVRYPHLVDGLQDEGTFSARSWPAAYLQPWKDPHYWGKNFEAMKRYKQLRPDGVVTIAEYTNPFSDEARRLAQAIEAQGFVPYITENKWQARGRGLGINPGW